MRAYLIAGLLVVLALAPSGLTVIGAIYAPRATMIALVSLVGSVAALALVLVFLGLAESLRDPAPPTKEPR